MNSCEFGRVLCAAARGGPEGPENLAVLVPIGS